jgi:hypothetical protein
MSAILRLRRVVDRFKRFDAKVSSDRETMMVGNISLEFTVLKSPVSHRGSRDWIIVRFNGERLATGGRDDILRMTISIQSRDI